MKTAFLQQGKRFMPVDPLQINVREVLPPSVYSIGQTPQGEFFLESAESFNLPSKLYGDVEQKATRIINTFEVRPNSTGVLLSGEKGSGKTMLAKRVAEKLQKDNKYITILVNSELFGETFNRFLQSIEQPAVVIFDEFEKVYEHKNQQQLLTIFDGTYSSKKLFILTCNNINSIDAFMINRPGRIFYSINYKGLSKDFITEYCEDKLENKANVNSVLNVSKFFGEFSFDMMKALVEEMNRYNENASQAMEMLNINPSQDSYANHEIQVIRKGAVLRHNSPKEFMSGSPIGRNGYNFWLNPRDLEDDDMKGYGSDEIAVDEMFTIDTAKLEGVGVNGYDFIIGTDDPHTKLAFTRERLTTSIYNYDSYSSSAGLLA